MPPAPAAVAQYQGVKPDPHIADGTLQHKLDVAKELEGRGRELLPLPDPGQLLLSPGQDPERLVVEGGVATRFPSYYRSVATVLRLFKTIQGAIDDGVANLDVTYAKRGVPRSIYIDPSQLIVDEEVGYTIKAFTPSKRHGR